MNKYNGIGTSTPHAYKPSKQCADWKIYIKTAGFYLALKEPKKTTEEVCNIAQVKMHRIIDWDYNRILRPFVTSALQQNNFIHLEKNRYKEYCLPFS